LSHRQITEKNITVDLTLAILGVSLAVTAIAAVEYYRKIQLAHKEYVKARDFIEDIVLSFNRELKRESEKFDSVTTQIESSQTTAEASYRKAESIEKKIDPLEKQLGGLSYLRQEFGQKIEQALTENKQDNTTLISGISSLTKKIKEIEDIQDLLKNKITSFEDQFQKLSISPPTRSDLGNEVGLSPIIIKRDKALAALTETEIVVLEMLSKEGAKTAPEIKERVHLSREHTARLMKKLYEEGYLEREADKIPFRYSVKKEMEALLQKAENSEVS
jgi:DNA-binding MarR family transcriptional regulator